MRLVLVLALAACTESPEEHLDRLKADADTTCWSYHCPDGPGVPLPSKPASIEDGVSCMNDALASGALAMTSWQVDSFNPWLTRFTYVFTEDHAVKVFTSVAHGPDPESEIHEQTCSGTLQIGASICTYMDPQGGAVPVQALALDGCQ